jgi:hypothetical protein
MDKIKNTEELFVTEALWKLVDLAATKQYVDANSLAQKLRELPRVTINNLLSKISSSNWSSSWYGSTKSPTIAKNKIASSSSFYNSEKGSPAHYHLIETLTNFLKLFAETNNLPAPSFKELLEASSAKGVLNYSYILLFSAIYALNFDDPFERVPLHSLEEFDVLNDASQVFCIKLPSHSMAFLTCNRYRNHFVFENVEFSYLFRLYKKEDSDKLLTMTSPIKMHIKQLKDRVEQIKMAIKQDFLADDTNMRGFLQDKAYFYLTIISFYESVCLDNPK